MQDMMTHGIFSWQEHSSQQTEAARNFYQTVLGWNIEVVDHQDGRTCRTAKVDDKPLGGFVESEGQAAWLPYITVDDVDARVKTAIASGASIVREPVDMPGVGRMATLKDPQGASIALITYESMMPGGNA